MRNKSLYDEQAIRGELKILQERLHFTDRVIEHLQSSLNQLLSLPQSPFEKQNPVFQVSQEGLEQVISQTMEIWADLLDELERKEDIFQRIKSWKK